MARTFIVVFSILSTLAACSYAITTAEDEDVAQACLDLINRNNANLAGFVRVAFHDAVGGPDGCIDVDLTDANGEKPNAGLGQFLNPLNSGYTNCGFASTGVSRADFYAKCGAVATEVGRRNAEVIAGAGSTSASDLDITFKYGRIDRDCATSQLETADAFPNPREGLTATLAWCAAEIGQLDNTGTFVGLTDRECVALLGAHTLGKARQTASGYENPWMAGAEERALNNGYYTDMLDTVSHRWLQNNVEPNNALSFPEAKWQWGIGAGGSNRLMLNSDMCLAYAINPDQAGENAIKNSRASTLGASTTRPIVQIFSDDNILWLNEFGQVFTKMINNRLSDTALTDVVGGPAGIPLTVASPTCTRRGPQG